MNWGLLLDALIVLAAAMVCGAIAERLRQSAIIGYMVAGLLIGPKVFGIISQREGDTIVAISTLGVTLLMFSIGLEFSWSKLKRLGWTALATGGLQIGLTTAAGVAGLVMLGVTPAAALALSLAIAMSSTGVVMPALARAGGVDSTHGRFALGILLVQDAAVVPAILIVGAMGGAVATGAAGPDASAALADPDAARGVVGVVLEVLRSFLIVGLFIAGSALFVRFVLPAMVNFVGSARNREMPVIFAIVASMGAAWGANELGLSPALGAFIAAIFLGESVIATQLRSDMGPFRIAFVTLFFASIGMLADPVWIGRNLPLVAMAVAAVVIGKPLVVYAVGKAFKLTHRSAVAAGLCMGQVGVFSFVLAQIARDNGVFGDGPSGDTLFNLVVSIAIVTLFLTPYLVEFAPAAGQAVENGLRRIGIKTRAVSETVRRDDLAGHVVVAGYGPAGERAAERLYRDGTTVIVLDLNPGSVLRARRRGMRAYVGDAGNPELLAAMKLEAAEALILALPDHRQCLAILVEAKLICPTLRCVSRARYHRYVDVLSAAGADVVVDEEAIAGEDLARALPGRARLSSSATDKPADPTPATSALNAAG